MFEYLMPLLLDARSPAHALWTRAPPGGGCPPDRVRAAGRASPGASPSRPSPPSTSTRSISIRPSAYLGLGLKRGLADDLVVAPYASALALMVDPAAGAGEPQTARQGRDCVAHAATMNRSTTPDSARGRRATAWWSHAFMGAPPGNGAPCARQRSSPDVMPARFHADRRVHAGNRSSSSGFRRSAPLLVEATSAPSRRRPGWSSGPAEPDDRFSMRRPAPATHLLGNG